MRYFHKGEYEQHREVEREIDCWAVLEPNSSHAHRMQSWFAMTVLTRRLIEIDPREMERQNILNMN